jgi:hypothetical protein
MKLELYPTPKNPSLGKIRVTVELSRTEILKVNDMTSKQRNKFIKSKANITVNGIDIDYNVPDLSEWDVLEY